MDAGVAKKALETAEEKVLEAVRMKPEGVTERVDSARRAVKHGLFLAEDAIEDATHEMKRHPFRTLVTGFTVGVFTGAFGGWLLSRKCKK